MRHDPLVQILERTRDILEGERGAVLRLSPGTFQENDQLARNGEGGGAAEIIIDECECEIDAGRDPSRCPDAPILDEDRITLDMECREPCGEFGAPAPVRRNAPSVEQPRRGEEECAGANRGEPANMPRAL